MFKNSIRLAKLGRVARFTPIKYSRVSFGPTQTKSASLIGIRGYSSAPELTPAIIQDRLLEILEGYEKVPKDAKITPETDFSKDLGLDSLDLVEVVMAIEEEFSIGIPDEQADKLRTFKDAVELVKNDHNST